MFPYCLQTFNPQQKVETHVQLPRFKLETTLKLNEPVMASGLTDIFSDNECDLSLLAEESKGLHVSSVVQKAFIEVNEEGTEAAAATGMTVMLCCYVEPMIFHCNKPFFVAITDDVTEMALFTGRVMDPTAN